MKILNLYAGIGGNSRGDGEVHSGGLINIQSIFLSVLVLAFIFVLGIFILSKLAPSEKIVTDCINCDPSFMPYFPNFWLLLGVVVGFGAILMLVLRFINPNMPPEYTDNSSDKRRDY